MFANIPLVALLVAVAASASPINIRQVSVSSSVASNATDVFSSIPTPTGTFSAGPKPTGSPVFMCSMVTSSGVATATESATLSSTDTLVTDVLPTETTSTSAAEATTTDATTSEASATDDEVLRRQVETTELSSSIATPTAVASASATGTASRHSKPTPTTIVLADGSSMECVQMLGGGHGGHGGHGGPAPTGTAVPSSLAFTASASEATTTATA